MEGVEQLEVLGHDASGGVFTVGMERSTGMTPVFYASSEGQAGVLAESVHELLELMVTFPYWRDCLKFSGRGQLAEMRRAVPLLERELLEDADAPAKRRRLASMLRLVAGHAVETLHAHVAGGDRYKIASVEDGEELEGLFNKFVVDDNPMWR